VGYDLHITRAKFWADNDRCQISSDEWLAYVARDPELSPVPENGPYFAAWKGKSKYPDPWLDWSRGNISTKYPDEPLIDKMVTIAAALAAHVQGDDGEVYRSGHEPPIAPQPSALDRLRNWINRVRPRPPIKGIVPIFNVGDTVLDVFGKETTVIEIDAKANHGLGRVRVRYSDGREGAFALAASGLKCIDRHGD